ncbi:DoxX family membrane protein [Actinomycetospora sp. CA-101289]|uniref:DoxX family membrane protein n=1 Tax=Actinomycetospora sp. CA-101289 TaxID=3239893 RepID=UPI003D95DAB5
MAWMDRARRLGGLLWVAVGVVFGVGWAQIGGVVPGPITQVLAAVVLGLAVVVVVDHVRGVPWLLWASGWLAAVLLAAAFGGAVADRFGVFGPPGAAGVSWGRWDVFVAYTQQLLHGVPLPVAAVVAVVATVTEVVLAVGLLSGWQRRWVAKAAAGLLTIYLLAMASTVGWDDVARYALPIEIGGALLVSVCPPRRTAPRPRGSGVGSIATSAARTT